MTAQTGPAGQGMLLVVDDQAILCTVLQHMLEAWGFTALVARSGRLGVALFHQHAREVRAVLLDLWLPGESAAGVFDAVRRLRPDLPVILMSGIPEAIAREEFARAGVTAFLQKPFDIPVLLKTLHEALEAGPPAQGPEASRGN